MASSRCRARGRNYSNDPRSNPRTSKAEDRKSTHDPEECRPVFGSDHASRKTLMSGVLYEEEYIGLFLLVTVIMGGGAAWLAGRAIAATWRPWWHVAFYMLILGLAVRFIHFALFEGTLLSPQYYAVDTVVCLIFGFLGFRATRVAQMTTQYGWINVRAGFLRWARRTAAPEKSD